MKTYAREIQKKLGGKCPACGNEDFTTPHASEERLRRLNVPDTDCIVEMCLVCSYPRAWHKFGQVKESSIMKRKSFMDYIIEFIIRKVQK